MQLDKNLYNEINEYCKLNGIKTRDFVHKLLKDAFLKEKYGETPFDNPKKNEKIEIDEERNDNVIKIVEKTVGIELSTVTPSETYEKITIPDNIIKSYGFTPINETEEVKPKPKKKRKLS
jgi:hypothetical protein